MNDEPSFESRIIAQTVLDSFASAYHVTGPSQILARAQVIAAAARAIDTMVRTLKREKELP